MKSDLVNAIKESMLAVKLPVQVGGEADLSVNVELLDLAASSGTKSLQYENSILVSEKDCTVFFYEKITEKSKGFSFGSSSESSFQSGKSLKRRVSGTFLGIDGTKVSYDFDLGDISRTIKADSEKAGYKFKIVLRRKSASF